MMGTVQKIGATVAIVGCMLYVVLGPELMRPMGMIGGGLLMLVWPRRSAN